MSEKKSEKQVIDHLKGYFLKNNYVLVFSILAAIVFVGFLMNSFSFQPGFLMNIPFFGTIIGSSFILPASYMFFLFFTMAAASVLSYYNRIHLAFILVLIFILAMTFHIRTQNVPDLVNAATGEPTLGPDLDPYLFQRHAEEIVEGRLENPDTKRLSPTGTFNYAYRNLEPWMIASVYWTGNIFTDVTIMEAGIFSTPIYFTLSVIPFFLLLFFLFSFTLSRNKSLIGASIGTFLYSISPIILARSVAGIPESEGHSLIWFFLAFLFFTLAWKQKDMKKISIFAILAGIFTGIMGWTWGGDSYIYMIVALTSMMLFLFEKDKTKNLVIMSLFTIFSFVIVIINRSIGGGSLDTIFSLATSFTDTGLVLGTLFLLAVDHILFRTKIKKKVKPYFEKVKLPENIVSIIVATVLGSAALLLVKPQFLISLIPNIFEKFINPFGTGRIGQTVAENRLPYFSEVIGTFGVLFWLFLFAVIFIFYDATKHFKAKQRFLLNSSFIIFIITFIFSRISPSHVLNGVNAMSKTLYFGGMILFGAALVYIYIKAYKDRDEETLNDFKKIQFSHIFIIAFSVLAIFSLRVAIRFFIVAAPLMLLAVAYIPLSLWENSSKTKDKTIKTTLVAGFIISLLILSSVGAIQAGTINARSKSMIPSSYNEQWHHAMHWADQNTPEDAVFAHWWDYGYWVQTLGNRATIADGGQPGGGERNHFIGRYILTAQNSQTALNTLKTFGATHLLIDSTDVGKYSAYASIGSDATGKDRLSWISYFGLDQQETQQTENSTILVYTGQGTAIDDNIEVGDKFYPMERAGIGGFLVHVDKETEQILRVETALIYNNQQNFIPIRYINMEGQTIDLSPNYGDEEYIESMLYLIPALEGQGINRIGVGMYLSEKSLNTQWVKLYLLEENEHFELVHKEDSAIIKQLEQQGFEGDFIYYQGFQGPIKIWEINYTPQTQTHQEYIQWNYLEEEDSWGKLDYLGV